jgi:hypothetical protein
MKQETTQNIIKRSKSTKLLAEEWEHVYIDIYRKLNETKEWRSLRANNTIFIFKKVDKIAAGYVFTVDPPLLQGKNFVEFAKSLGKAGFEYFSTYVNNPIPLKFVQDAGYEVEIGEIIGDDEFAEVAISTATAEGEPSE